MKKESQSGIYKSGFGLIEVVIAIALVAIVLAVALPNIGGRRTVQERNGFVTHLNAVLSEVWLRGLQQGKIHKINFDLEKRMISVSQETDKLDADKKIIFTPVQLYFSSQKYVWPESFDIQQLYVERNDEMASGGISRKTENVWFYMMPDGMCQEVIMNIVDNPQGVPEKDAPHLSVVINPFTAQCVTYDTFQKPLS